MNAARARGTARTTLTRIRAVGPAGGPIPAAGLSEGGVRRSALRILGDNVLCSMATAGRGGRPHIHTAYFAFTGGFDLVFLSHPRALHCRNLERSAWAATAVFASRQDWSGPDRGMQLFGRCAPAGGRRARDAERLYARRFPAYRRWKSTREPGATAAAYRFYRFVVSSLKMLDERRFGDGVFITASVRRRQA